MLLSDVVSAQIAFSDLSKIGVIEGKNYNLKIKGPPSDQLMVIKFIPDISNMTQCGQPAMQNYKDMITRILTPINSSLTQMKSYYHNRDSGVRFVGAVLGGIALGVATSAQITAGFALHNSIQNANAIKGIKEAIKNSNQAIESLTAAGKKTVIAINGLQDQINSQIVPVMNTIGCQVAENSLALRLNQYFSEVSLIFGPNLRDPASETLAIQAISRAFGGDFESILKRLGYHGSDLLDIMESDSIRARIIDVDLENYFISLQIEYPTLIVIPNAVVQEFSLISYNELGTEWMSIFPNHLLVRNSLISNIDLLGCTRTTNSYICSKDTSTPISQPLWECATGDTSKCARKRVVTSAVSRFALSKGVIFANCIPITCICQSTNQNIIQDAKSTTVMISSSFCNEIQIDGVYIQIGPPSLNRTVFTNDVKLGQQVSTDPIDISNQLAEVDKELDKAKKHLKKSNEILNKINPQIVNTGVMTFVFIATIVILIWAVITMTWLIYLTRRIEHISNASVFYRNQSTVNSLSSLIPST